MFANAPHPAPVPTPPSPGLALCDYTVAELATAQTALAEPGDELHEGVHRARKALRRSRAALALGDGILGPGAALLDRELHAINTGLSQLRDAHALIETLERLLDDKLAAKTRQLLLRAQAAAVAVRAMRTELELNRDPDLGRRRALIAVLRAALPALEWAPMTPAALRMGLADSDWRMQQACARALRSGGNDADWHRWRRRARRASQQRRALEAIGLNPGAMAPEVFDKPTVERLGLAQDLSLLLAHCGDDSPFSQDDRDALQRYAAPALARLRRRIAKAAHEQAT